MQTKIWVSTYRESTVKINTASEPYQLSMPPQPTVITFPTTSISTQIVTWRCKYDTWDLINT
jgi:hypothetical protein